MPLLSLAQEKGLTPKKVASTEGGELHSACPSCGGKDRFIIQPNKKMTKCLGRYFCRKCGISGDTIQFGRDFLGLSFQDAADRALADVPKKTVFSYRFNEIKTNRYVQLKSPVSKWFEKAKNYVDKMHKQILQKSDVLDFLKQRGIPLEAVTRYKIGWNNKDIWENKSDWGIEGKEGGCIWLPKGILIPTTESSGRILRLKVRRSDWKETDLLSKYVVVSGGMNGLNIIGDINHDVMVVVESELDAYAIHHVIGNFAFVIAVGSNIKNPDNVTDRLAKRVTTLLICHDNDDAGKLMVDKWKKLYSHAYGCSTPTGKDVGEYVENGGDMELFFYNILERDDYV